MKIRIGGLQLGDAPKIAVAVGDGESAEEITRRGIDVLELRVDQFRSHDPAAVETIVRSRAQLGIPLILTVRNDPAEGGNSGISEERKFEIFQRIGPLVDAFDIELGSPGRDSLAALARRGGKTLILSKHDFKGTPPLESLEAFSADARRQGADIFKFAAMPADLEDVRTMLTFTLRHRDEGVITMSLGAVGAISRVLFPLAGSLLTYTFVDRPSAPGQIPLERLQEQLRLYSPEYEKHYRRCLDPAS